MAVKSLTKDGKYPVTVRFDAETYEDLRKVAFEMDLTCNKAMYEIVKDFLSKNARREV